ncbi:SDR family oxidoreductase [Methylocella silvestris]|uniref:Short-chain dehydrogenase n=1 Tax=Methylocella silvestris TaxID=199596 RepID=A0A2J7TH36_METSI|nr:SDR family oxidoreductase [Methylocella silvestris]PNG26078.1 short-chain dehydrogenase [Methylocella silvestris]
MALKDKRIIVLGGTSGIGLAVAEAAATDGAKVLVASRDEARIKRALTELPAGVEGYALDLSNAAAIEAFFDAVGPFDHLVYTAGESLKLSPLAEGDIASVRHFFEVRYWGAFMAARWGHRHIRTGGSIVFTSGVAAARPGPGWSVAASICGAMEGLTRALAVELAPMRVNIVSPGVVKTPLWREMPEEARESLYASEARRLPVGHVADAQEIAKGYLYLMRQTFVTGQTLVIDGGGLLV